MTEHKMQQVNVKKLVDFYQTPNQNQLRASVRHYRTDTMYGKDNFNKASNSKTILTNMKSKVKKYQDRQKQA